MSNFFSKLRSKMTPARLAVAAAVGVVAVSAGLYVTTKSINPLISTTPNMLLLSPGEIQARFGPSYPTGGGRRFNSDRPATLHRTPTHVFEFGYQGGYNFYVIVQKRAGSFTAIEREALLASYDKAKGKWGPVDAPKTTADAGGKKDKTGAKENKSTSNGYPLAFKFTPADGETFSTPVFASHQREGHQIVMWHPQCQIDLAQIVANPLVY